MPESQSAILQKKRGRARWLLEGISNLTLFYMGSVRVLPALSRLVRVGVWYCMMRSVWSAS
jgi:hypothetical protein